MFQELIDKMESAVDTDDMEYVVDICMEEMINKGAGEEMIEPLFRLMERHPVSEFGCPGGIVQFIESFPNEEEFLLKSLNRKPTTHTLWMLNRLINVSSNKGEYIKILKEISESTDFEKDVLEVAKDFLDYQEKNI